MTYPFTAVVGQEDMKLALILNLIDPQIGGVMMMGDRGTGKSTVVRSLVDVLPDITVEEGDPYNREPKDIPDSDRDRDDNGKSSEEKRVINISTPMVDLPLGATEDRVCGTIDIEKAISEGAKVFEPGLLASANRGLLYVDEANLLDDHLVDILLDSAASGYNTVEREGISIQHPARFILIGSGNPEEGELRPQLLDRFGMYVKVKTELRPGSRIQIVGERLRFDADPQEFFKSYQDTQDKLKKRITDARSILKNIRVETEVSQVISQGCAELGVDGIRGDIVLTRALKADVAWRYACEDRNGKESINDSSTLQPLIPITVTLSDLVKSGVPGLCLAHRLRKDALSTVDSSEKINLYFSELLDRI